MGSGAPCVGCNWHEKNPAPAVLARRGRTSPLLCAAIWRRRLLWKAVRFVCAVTAMRIAPRRRRELHAGSTRPPYWRGAKSMQAQPARPSGRKRVQAQPAALAASAACEGFLWAVIRFVFAVTGMRRTPRPMGAEEGAGSACPHARRAKFLWKAVRSIMSKRSYGK